MTTSPTLLEWKAFNHAPRNRPVGWYIAFAIIATVIVCILIIFRNFIAAIAIGLVSGLVYYVIQQKPQATQYQVRVDGIGINNLLYPYKELTSFNIIYQPGETKTLFMRAKRRFAPMLRLEIGEADPVAIRTQLLQFVPEDQDMEEPFIDVFSRRLGF